MDNLNENSTAQAWNLELICKNREYLDAVINSILKQGLFDFKVELIEGSFNSNDIYDGSYKVTVNCCWFHNLKILSKELYKIEKQLEPK